MFVFSTALVLWVFIGLNLNWNFDVFPGVGEDGRDSVCAAGIRVSMTTADESSCWIFLGGLVACGGVLGLLQIGLSEGVVDTLG